MTTQEAALSHMPPVPSLPALAFCPYTHHPDDAGNMGLNCSRLLLLPRPELVVEAGTAGCCLVPPALPGPLELLLDLELWWRPGLQVDGVLAGLASHAAAQAGVAPNRETRLWVTAVRRAWLGGETQYRMVGMVGGVYPGRAGLPAHHLNLLTDKLAGVCGEPGLAARLETASLGYCGLLGPGRAEAAADYARSNLALVVVTGQQEVERPAAVPWWERLGTAGGLLALTLGFSVLSLLEILHHCLGFVVMLWQEKQK